MLACVEQDVPQRAARCARRLQRASMISIGEYLAPAVKLPVDRARDADRQTLHSARQSATVRCLREQVQMIALHRKMHEPKAKTLTARHQRSAHLHEKLPRAQCRYLWPHAQCDVQRVMPRVLGPPQMSHARAPSLRLSTRARSCSAPAAKPKRTLVHRASPHQSLSAELPPHPHHLPSIVRVDNLDEMSSSDRGADDVNRGTDFIGH